MAARLDDIISYLRANYRASAFASHTYAKRDVFKGFPLFRHFWFLFGFIKRGWRAVCRTECTVIWTENSVAKLSFKATPEVPIMPGLPTQLCAHLGLQSALGALLFCVCISLRLCMRLNLLETLLL